MSNFYISEYFQMYHYIDIVNVCRCKFTTHFPSKICFAYSLDLGQNIVISCFPLSKKAKNYRYGRWQPLFYIFKYAAYKKCIDLNNTISYSCISKNGITNSKSTSKIFSQQFWIKIVMVNHLALLARFHFHVFIFTTFFGVLYH